MRELRLSCCFGVLLMTATSAAASAQSDAEAVIALERAALDRWGRGDPQGYLETYAPVITYFDPAAERRVDGLAAMRALLEPITGSIAIDRYEMIDPRVQAAGDIAVLSYNLVSHAKRPDGDSIVVRWNSTAVYRRISGQWRIIHSHWSFTRPELRTPISGRPDAAPFS